MSGDSAVSEFASAAGGSDIDEDRSDDDLNKNLVMANVSQEEIKQSEDCDDKGSEMYLPSCSKVVQNITCEQARQEESPKKKTFSCENSNSCSETPNKALMRIAAALTGEDSSCFKTPTKLPPRKSPNFKVLDVNSPFKSIKRSPSKSPKKTQLKLKTSKNSAGVNSTASKSKR